MSHKKKKKFNTAITKQDQLQLQQQQLQQRQAVLEMYSGPLPKPDDLIKYNQTYPDAAKIILEGFQKQTEHRIKMETVVLSGNSKRSDRGQIMAFILAIIIIGFGGTLVLLGKSLEGFILLVGTVSTLIGILD